MATAITAAAPAATVVRQPRVVESMLSDVFVHFKLWIDERERIVPRCLVPAKSKVRNKKAIV